MILDRGQEEIRSGGFRSDIIYLIGVQPNLTATSDLWAPFALDH